MCTDDNYFRRLAHSFSLSFDVHDLPAVSQIRLQAHRVTQLPELSGEVLSRALQLKVMGGVSLTDAAGQHVHVPLQFRDSSRPHLESKAAILPYGSCPAWRSSDIPPPKTTRL